jgi:hypothetical protein
MSVTAEFHATDVVDARVCKLVEYAVVESWHYLDLVEQMPIRLVQSKSMSNINTTNIEQYDCALRNPNGGLTVCAPACRIAETPLELLCLDMDRNCGL